MVHFGIRCSCIFPSSIILWQIVQTLQNHFANINVCRINYEIEQVESPNAKQTKGNWPEIYIFFNVEGGTWSKSKSMYLLYEQKALHDSQIVHVEKYVCVHVHAESIVVMEYGFFHLGKRLSLIAAVMSNAEFSFVWCNELWIFINNICPENEIMF